MGEQAKNQMMFDKIDLHLIRVLNTVLTERSVSRAAIRLGMYQPAVSAALKRLRALAGDPILVRSGAGMVPTDAGLRMVEPSASILRAAGMLFSDARGFEPATAEVTFRLAASDYLDPLFLPQLVAQIKAQAPLCHIEIQPLSAESDYRSHLAQGQVDIVIGNWAACLATRWCAWSPKTIRRCGGAGPMLRPGWRPSTSPPAPRTRERKA
jgi:DNA-binding transcriptional LysR family regulator